MCNMFKDHFSVAQVLSRNPKEIDWKNVCIVFGEVSGLLAKLSKTSVHAPFGDKVEQLLCIAQDMCKKIIF